MYRSSTTMVLSLAILRGVSSTVRRCIHKETGREYAAKIIDISSDTEGAGPTSLYQATKREIELLRKVAGHPYISMCHSCLCLYLVIFLYRISGSPN